MCSSPLMAISIQSIYLVHPPSLTGVKVLPVSYLSSSVGILLKGTLRFLRRARETFFTGARASCCIRGPSLSLREFSSSETITSLSTFYYSTYSRRTRRLFPFASLGFPFHSRSDCSVGKSQTFRTSLFAPIDFFSSPCSTVIAYTFWVL